ncbi:MAG: leucine-rich repeat domain-containing protein [Lachnospiraceae bacterium]|nr:leucine-rich repeat domain-containing protein [Lachnospiraceae bacterium]
MRRSIKKAIAFITFLAMSLQIFVTSDAEMVHAEESKISFETENYYGVCKIVNPTESVTIPYGIETEYGVTDRVDLSLYETGVKSLTIENGYTNVAIYSADTLEELILPKGLETLSIYGALSLKKLDIPKGTSNIYISEVNLEKLDIPASCDSLDISWCDKLTSVDLKEGLKTYTQRGCENISSVKIPATVTYLFSDDFSNMSISPDNVHYAIYEGSLYRDNCLVQAANDEVLNVKEGTVGIEYCALCNCYAITTINIPDSVETLEYGALAGAVNVKKLKLPKGLLCIYSYAFSNLGADSIEIPSSVSYVAEDAFYEYDGSVTIENGRCDVLDVYNGSVYTKDYGTLLKYPVNSKALELHKDCLTIEYGALNGCIFETLDIPEGIGTISLNLLNCTNLKTINIPSSVVYVSDCFSIPISLTKFTVDKKNQFYASYGGCLYSKDYQYLYKVPAGLEDVEVANGCITIGYYAFGDRYYYDPENDYYVQKELNIELPGTIRDIKELYYITSAKVDVGTTAAQILQYHNKNDYMPITYEFTDSDKAILKKIVVSDDIQMDKTDKNQYVTYTYPPGLNMVSQFTPIHENTNIYCKVTFTSKNKSVCKVNKKTGKLTPVKKGTAIIKVKCQMPSGKKKTYTTKVTVK